MQNNRLQDALHNFRKLPFSMQLVYVLGFAFLAFNIALLVSQLSSLTWKIDPGVATLIGAVIGLCVVAWQTGRGFKNLVNSQENEARLEREARLHQAELEGLSFERQQRSQTKLLLSALRAEIVHLHTAVSEAARMSNAMQLVYEQYEQQGAPATTKEFSFQTFDAPIFRANIPNLGLLGASLGGDVVKVLSRADGKDKSVKMAQPMPHHLIRTMYKGNAELLNMWRLDLFHVAMRIRAVEDSTQDPGTLVQTEKERYSALSSKPVASQATKK